MIRPVTDGLPVVRCILVVQTTRAKTAGLGGRSTTWLFSSLKTRCSRCTTCGCIARSRSKCPPRLTGECTLTYTMTVIQWKCPCQLTKRWASYIDGFPGSFAYFYVNTCEE